MPQPIPTELKIQKQLSAHPRWMAFSSILATIILCVTISVTDVNRIRDRTTGDFVHFFWAADAMRRGSDPYSSGTNGYIYPPLIAFVFQPLSYLGRDRAAGVMLAINIAVTLCTVTLAAAEFLQRFGNPKNSAGLPAVVLLAMLLNVDKVKGEWQMWQTDVFMLLCFVVALRWLDRRPFAAGIALGIAVNIKYLPLLFIPYLLLRRRWTTCAALALGTLVFALLPAISTGWTANNKNLGTAVTGLLQMANIQTAPVEAAHIHRVKDALSCSITSSFVRATTPAMGFLVSGLTASLIIAITAWSYRRQGLSLLNPALSNNPAITAAEWVMLIAGVLSFSPQTNTRHLFDALIFTTAAAVLLLAPRPGANQGVNPVVNRAVNRLPLIIGTSILFLGFILPFGNRTSSGEMTPTLHWLRAAGPCWCLLIAAFSLLWTITQSESKVG